MRSLFAGPRGNGPVRIVRRHRRAITSPGRPTVDRWAARVRSRPHRPGQRHVHGLPPRRRVPRERISAMPSGLLKRLRIGPREPPSPPRNLPSPGLVRIRPGRPEDAATMRRAPRLAPARASGLPGTGWPCQPAAKARMAAVAHTSSRCRSPPNPCCKVVRPMGSPSSGSILAGRQPAADTRGVHPMSDMRGPPQRIGTRIHTWWVTTIAS